LKAGVRVPDLVPRVLSLTREVYSNLHQRTMVVNYESIYKNLTIIIVVKLRKIPDTEHNNIQHKDIQRKDTQYNDIQLNGLNCDTRHKHQVSLWGASLC
jgi:hypothetical protein